MTEKFSIIYGVGINDATYRVKEHERQGNSYKVSWYCPYYLSWRSMIGRCYDYASKSKFKSFAGYKGCSVCSEWLRFSAFRAWMKDQDWEGKELDKDILIPGNKVYSPETCTFVSRNLNAFLVGCESKNSGLPTGASLHKRSGLYRARCRNPFNRSIETLGYFSDPSDAHSAWRRRKHELACQYAELQEDSRVAEALVRRFSC